LEELCFVETRRMSSKEARQTITMSRQMAHTKTPVGSEVTVKVTCVLIKMIMITATQVTTVAITKNVS